MEIINKYYIMKKLEKRNIKKFINKASNDRLYINVKKYLLLTIFIILIIIFPTSFSKQIVFRKLTSNYEISITINGTGNQYILSDNCRIDNESYNFNTLPRQIIQNKI